MDRRVDAERESAVGVDGASLALGVVAHERDGIGVRRIVLDVGRRDDDERDVELLEDRTALG